MQAKLAKPPLIEAVCELRLDPGATWDLTISGRLFDKLQPLFPQKRQTLGLEVKFNPQGMPDPDYRQIENLQFLSSDSKNVVQIREHYLSVSRLAPYEAWERYKPSVLDVFQQFTAVVGEVPIARVGLKYVNRIVIPTQEIRLEQYFDLYPHLGTRLPQRHGPFLTGVIFPYDDLTDLLKAEITSADPVSPNEYHVLLSLDHFTTNKERVNFKVLPDWLESAHARIEDVFHATLTAAAMQLFE
jgi:uncharacterized protein (TIGR04255 family)